MSVIKKHEHTSKLEWKEPKMYICRNPHYVRAFTWAADITGNIVWRNAVSLSYTGMAGGVGGGVVVFFFTIHKRFWHLWHNGYFIHWMLLENTRLPWYQCLHCIKKTRGWSTKTHRLFLFLGYLDRCGKDPCPSRELYYLLENNNLLLCPLPRPQCNITSLFYLEAISMWHHDHHSIPTFTNETGGWAWNSNLCIIWEAEHQRLSLGILKANQISCGRIQGQISSFLCALCRKHNQDTGYSRSVASNSNGGVCWRTMF